MGHGPEARGTGRLARRATNPVGVWSGPSAGDSYEIERGPGQSWAAGKRCGTGTARLLVLCAVLFGLFSMHGAPANAAAGCHGEMATVPTTRPSTEPMDMGHAAMRAEQLVPGRRRRHGASGELCVSTAARERLPLAATGLLAAARWGAWWS